MPKMCENTRLRDTPDHKQKKRKKKKFNAFNSRDINRQRKYDLLRQRNMFSLVLSNNCAPLFPPIHIYYIFIILVSRD